MKLDYDAIEKFARAATQGEREVGTYCEKGIISYFIYLRETGFKLFRVFASGYHEKEAEDAEFIAAANPTAILEMIAHIRSLEGAMGWKTIDRKEYPKNYEILKHSQGFMEELVDMQKDHARLQEERIGKLREGLLRIHSHSSGYTPGYCGSGCPVCISKGVIAADDELAKGVGG